MKQKIAMCTGITGQDGSYLAELLLSKGYRVIGLKRRTSMHNTERVDHLYHHPGFKMEYFDLNDGGRIYSLINKYKPDEFYHLAAMSHVKVSFQIPENTVDGIAMGTLRILNAVKDISPKTRLYFAASSEMFGDNPQLPLNESSIFSPVSPYACAKVFGYHIIKNYRKSYNLHVSSGILFNHESPRRGPTFVTRKITLAAARIKLGLQDKLVLGNLEAQRDWGYAKDFVEAMWLMLQQDKPDDYVVATGEMHTVRYFLENVFNKAGLSIDEHVIIDPKYFRPQEVPALLGDPSKAKVVLGWEPKVKFEELASKMYEADLKKVKLEIARGAKKWDIK